MHDEQDEQSQGSWREPKISQSYQIELTVKGPIHLHSHGESSPEDLFLLGHIESRLKRAASRLTSLDAKYPPK